MEFTKQEYTMSNNTKQDHTIYTEDNLKVIQNLWAEALYVQDGVNSTAIAMGMHQCGKNLMKIYRNTTKVNTHSIMQLWTYRLAMLANWDCMDCGLDFDELWGEICNNYNGDILNFKRGIKDYVCT